MYYSDKEDMRSDSGWANQFLFYVRVISVIRPWRDRSVVGGRKEFMKTDGQQGKSGDGVVALTIAGSDSGGGAGIQADIRTFQAFAVFPTCAITCLTAQNPDEVAGILPIEPEFVALQVETVCRAFPVAAAKTGMLYSAQVIEAVADLLRRCNIPRLIVDPVMVATSGARLLADDALKALCGKLIPMAEIITPNIPEAEVLCGHSIQSSAAARDAAREIGERVKTACVVKGGHLVSGNAGTITDFLFDGADCVEFASDAVSAVETHGTGCVFSAALTACRARGYSLTESVEHARNFVAHALATARPTGKHVPMNLSSINPR